MTSARRTKTYAAAAVAVADGVKTTFSTVAAPVVLTVADWNGAAITAAGLLDLPRTITISRSSASNQYSTNPIVLTGIRGGATVTESIAQPNDDGNDTLVGVQAFDFLTGVSIPTNGGTGGAYTIGVKDICAPRGDRFAGVEVAATGVLSLQYGEGAGSATDIFTVPAALVGYVKDVEPTRVRTGTNHTIVGVTVYLR